jgi:hypothetical protein
MAPPGAPPPLGGPPPLDCADDAEDEAEDDAEDEVVVGVVELEQALTETSAVAARDAAKLRRSAVVMNPKILRVDLSCVGQTLKSGSAVRFLRLRPHPAPLMARASVQQDRARTSSLESAHRDLEGAVA